MSVWLPILFHLPSNRNYVCWISKEYDDLFTPYKKSNHNLKRAGLLELELDKFSLCLQTLCSPLFTHLLWPDPGLSIFQMSIYFLSHISSSHHQSLSPPPMLITSHWAWSMVSLRNLAGISHHSYTRGPGQHGLEKYNLIVAKLLFKYIRF